MAKYMRTVGEVLSDSFLVNYEKLSIVPDHTLQHDLKRIQAELWVRHWFNRAKDLEQSGKAVSVMRGCRTVIAIEDKHGAPPRMGWAKCSPHDLKDRSLRIGIAVATARAFGEQIPDYI